MTLEPLVVDSIKDRIVRAVWALGPLATKAAIGRAVVCDSSILSIAIDAVHRDGYVYMSEAGHFVVAEELVPMMPTAAAPAAPAVATAGRNNSNREEGPEMSQQKYCPACEVTKSLREFDSHARRCKPCVAKNVPVKKAAPASAKKNCKTPRGSAQHASATPSAAEEIVIPAEGEIRCRVLDAGAGRAFSLHQGGDQITCSYAQLQAVRDWATLMLKSDEQ